MFAMSSRQTQDIDVDKLFCDLTVSKIEDELKALRLCITEKGERLRCLVSEKYRNIIDAADGIARMKKNAFNYKCIAEELDEKTISIQCSKSADVCKEMTMIEKGALCNFIIRSPLKIFEHLRRQNTAGAAKIFFLCEKILVYMNTNRVVFSIVPKFSKIFSYWEYLMKMSDMVLSHAKSIMGSADENYHVILNSICAVAFLKKLDLRNCASMFLTVRYENMENILKYNHHEICAVLQYYHDSIIYFNEIFQKFSETKGLITIFDTCLQDEDDQEYIYASKIASKYFPFLENLDLGSDVCVEVILNSWTENCLELIYSGIKDKIRNAADLNKLTDMCLLFDNQKSTVALALREDVIGVFIERARILLTEKWIKALEEIELTCNFEDRIYDNWLWSSTVSLSDPVTPPQIFEICSLLLNAFNRINFHLLALSQYVNIGPAAEFDKNLFSLLNKWLSLKYDVTVFHLCRVLISHSHLYGFINMNANDYRNSMTKAFSSYLTNHINQSNNSIKVKPLSCLWSENNDLLIPTHISNHLLSSIFTFNTNLNKAFAHTLDVNCLSDVIETYLCNLTFTESDKYEQHGRSFYLQNLFDLLLLNSIIQKKSLNTAIEEVKSCLDPVDLHAVYPALIEKVSLSHQQLMLFFGSFSPVNSIPDSSSNFLYLCPSTVQFETLPPAFTTIK